MPRRRLVTAKPAVLFAFALVASLMAVSAPDPANAQVGDPPSDTISLTGTVRDFQRSHPDFEFAIATDRGIVEPTIGADRKPVYAYTPPASSPTTTGRDNFDQWYRDVPGVTQATELTLTLDRVQDSPPLYRFDDSSFFPIDGLLWGNEGQSHNYWFTFELHAQFTYQGGEVFTFRGDDDVFVFIDDRLVIDLGGVHSAQTASVSLDSLGLTAGETYPLDLFFAERHTFASSFRIETTLQLQEVPDPEPDPEPVGVLPPVAAAGPDQTVPEGSTVQLDASGSSDPNPGLVERTFQSGNLPGGTSLEVSIDGLALAGDTTLLEGTAAVGEGPPVADTAIVYVVDLSGSANFAGGCGGDQNNDGAFDRIIDCEIASLLALHDQVLAAGTVSQVGLVTFSSGSATRDLNPTAAQQFLIAPDADADANGVLDLEQTLRTLRAGGATNFSSPASRACGLLAGSPVGNRVAVFLSDGQANRGTVLSNVLPCDPPATFESFAIGQGSSCTGGSTGRKLQDMADLTGGSCTDVTDPVDLPDILPEVIGSTLVRVLLTVDGGTPIDVTDSVDPLPPLPGPASAAVQATLPALADGVHEVCLTVEATDAGGTGSVTTCSLLRVGDAPLLFEWTLIDADGPPIVLSSTTDPAPTFQTADDATYLFELTVTNGFGLSATDRVEVTVENADPLMVVEPGQGVAGGVTLINASFTDQGYLDTHTATFDWGDGTEQTVPVTAQGSGWGGFFGSHIYASAGAYDVTITVTDDDGGSATTSLGGFVVADPVAVWANSETAAKTLDWVGSSGTIEGRVHTNNELRVVGQAKTIVGPSTYAGSLSADTDRHLFDPAPQPAPVEDYPIRFDVADYRPGGPVATAVGNAYHDKSSACASGKWHETQVVLDPGVYYADCDIQINGSDIGGAITLVAEGSIQVSGSRPAFEPYYDGLLFLAGASGDKAIDLAAADSKFLGVLFAELGEIDVSGSHNRFYCGILGDRVDLAGGDLEVRGASCGRPDSTVAGPLLVPELEMALVGQPGEVLPGETIDYDVSIANTGAILVAPGLIGLENVDVESATVQAYAYVLEYFSVAGGAWVPFASAAAAAAGYTPIVPLPTLGGIDLALRSNPFPGVTFATGADPVIGTVIDPDGFATWGAQAVVSVDPALVDTLLDPALVGGIRNRVTFELDPATVQVRRLFTFGSDFIDQLRALSGDVTDVELTMTLPTGDPLAFDATTTPALALLAPGATVALDHVYTAEVPAPRGEGETDDAYLNRLLAADGATLAASAFARASGGGGLLIAPTDVALATERLPVVDVTKTGPGFAVPGETLGYAITANNRGSVDAVTVVVADDFDGAPLALVPAVPATLSAGQVVGATASATVDPDALPGTLVNRVSGTWSDTAGNAYGPVGASVTTEVGLPAALTATLVDSLAIDADGNGLVTPGDTLRYEAVIANTGDLSLADVVFQLVPDSNTTLDAGSVVATDGTVDTAGGTITVTVASLAGRTGFSVFFEAEIADPLPEGVASVTQQGTVTATGLDPALTDDPAAPGLADPTVTFVVIPQPAIAATLAGSQSVDADGDGQVSPGDTLTYQLDVINNGGASATSVTANVDLPAPTTLGAVSSSQGTDQSMADMMTVDLGTIAAGGGTASVTFDLTLDAAWVAPEIALQGVVTSAELAPVHSDDPNTAAEADATVIPVAVAGGPGGGPGGGPAPSFGEVGPPEGEVVSQPVDVTGTVTPPEGETVDSWRVVAYPAGTDPAGGLVLGSGVGAPPPVLATFDPTLVANGLWTIRIEATSSGGGVSFAESDVIVEGNLKPGRFIASFQDLTTGIASMPLHVIRIYDSYDRTVGDFGVGHHLGSVGFEVSSNGPLGQGGWTMFQCGGGLIFATLCFETDAPHFVTVTWPNGDTESFDLTPTQGSTFFPGLTSAEFTGRDGSSSELEALDSGLFFTGDGNLYGGLFGTGGIYDPQRFRLTSRSGVEYVLDVDDGLLSRTDLAGNTLTFTPDGVFSSFGPSLEFDRDALGRIVTVTAPDGETIGYEYDAAGNLATVTDPLGNVTEYQYLDPRFPNYLSGVIDPLGNPFVRTVFDDDGRLIATCDADGNPVTLEGCTTSTYDIAGRLWTTVDPNGFRVDRVLDDRGNLVLERRWLDGVDFLDTVRTYDADDNMLTETDDDGNTWTFTYDDRGNLLTRVDPSGRRDQLFTYNADGQVLTDCDALDRCITHTYDDDGNLRFTEDRAGEVTEFRYNGFGQRTDVIHPDGSRWGFEYDSRGYPSSLIDPAGNAQQVDFNANGLLQSATDREGRTITLTYDAAGRIQTETWDTVPPRVTTYDYDAAGNVISAVDPDSSLTMTYLASGELAEIDNVGTPAPRVVVSFEFDGNGNLATVADSLGGVTEYEYEARDLLRSAQQFGTGVNDKRVELVHGRDGVLREVARFAALDGSLPVATTTPGYDCAPCDLSVSSIDHVAAAGGIVHAMQYVRDPVSNVIELTDAEGTHTYTYDELNRLRTVDHPAAGSAPDEFYTYDAIGNRLSSHLSAAYTYEPGSRLTQDDDFDYSYDREGNLINMRDRVSGEETAFEYDHRNRLTRAEIISSGGATLATVDYVYDASGRLIERAVNGVSEYYIYDHVNRILTLDALGNAIERRFHFPSIDEVVATESGGQTNWLITDLAGTVRDVIDDTGAAVAHYEYDSFGSVVASTGTLDNDVLFQSREFDDVTGLGYFRARNYDPNLGRFTEEDPQEPFGFDFVGSNPLVGIDPFGETTIVEYSIQIKNRVYIFALHGGHHPWVVLGKTIFCVHLQLITYLDGVKGSHVIKRLPLPWCRGSSFPRF